MDSPHISGTQLSTQQLHVVYQTQCMHALSPGCLERDVRLLERYSFISIALLEWVSIARSPSSAELWVLIWLPILLSVFVMSYDIYYYTGKSLGGEDISKKLESIWRHLFPLLSFLVIIVTLICHPFPAYAAFQFHML